MATERHIKTIERDDGQARLFILERDDGLFRFECEALIEDEVGFGPYWTPCNGSGLYATAAEAEAAARRDVLWLRDSALG